MKTDARKITSFLSRAALVACLCQAVVAKAQPVNLGAAGNFSILETGSGAANANISLAAAPPHGYANNNVGIASSGQLSDGGNLPINGNVYLASGATSSGLAGNVSGTINQNADLSAAVTAALTASAQASALGASGPTGGGVGIANINDNSGQPLTLQPGVYDLTDFKLQNGTVVTLAAGGNYVFNISGTLALNSSEILAASGLMNDDILFNITGTQGVAFSGGLNNECVLDGVILSEKATVSLTPGAVDGEIISGENINIASGGSVNNPPLTAVPEPSTIVSGLLLLVPLGVGVLRTLRKSRPQLQEIKS